MNIVEINYADLTGRAFNGYDLMCELNKRNWDVKQVVMLKHSESENVIGVDRDAILHKQLRYLEWKYSISNVLFPYAEQLLEMDVIKKADVLHFHILHNDFISLLDYPSLFNLKQSVWTIHDPWIITGNCIYPLKCEQWKYGCKKCIEYGDHRYEAAKNNTEVMWKLKKDILSKVNPNIIVSCDYMRTYLNQSPITKHFTNIYTIPFGVNLSFFHEKKYNVKNKIRVGLRVEDSKIKGCQFVFSALKNINLGENIEVIVVGSGKVPNEVKNKYCVYEMGWVDEKRIVEFMSSIDLFMMPSLAETFGLMAIESMAVGTPVLCFKDTVLEKITEAPICGIAVEYANVGEIEKVLIEIVNGNIDLKQRGRMSRMVVQEKYTFERYVCEHEKLYSNLAGKGKK